MGQFCSVKKDPKGIGKDPKGGEGALLHHSLDIADLEANLVSNMNSALTLDMQKQLSCLLNAQNHVAGLGTFYRASMRTARGAKPANSHHLNPMMQQRQREPQLPQPYANRIPQRVIGLVQDFLLGTGETFDVTFFELQKKGARLSFGEVKAFADVMRPNWLITSLDMRGCFLNERMKELLSDSLLSAPFGRLQHFVCDHWLLAAKDSVLDMSRQV